MTVIGVTGGLGSGKSAVARMFQQRGARVIDADRVVHDLLGPKGPAVAKVIKLFGPEYRGTRGVDRRLLGKKVFNDPKALKALESVLHPLAEKEVRRQLKLAGKEKLVVLDVPLLIESGWHRWVDKVIVVRASRHQQVARAAVRLGITPVEAAQRIRRQMPLSQKIKFADHVVDNRGGLDDTDRQVELIFSAIRRTGHQPSLKGRRQGGQVL